MRIRITPTMKKRIRIKSREFCNDYFDDAKMIAKKKGISFLDECRYQAEHYPFFVKYLSMLADYNQIDYEEEFLGVETLGRIQIES